MAIYNDYYVSPSPLLIIWTVLLLVSLPCGVVTAAKGRWVWFVGGFFAGCLPWLGTAFLRPLPDSPWARRAARRAAGGAE